MPTPWASASAHASPSRSIRFWNSFGIASITAAETRPVTRMIQCRECRAAILHTTPETQRIQLKKGPHARCSICLMLVVSQEIYSPVSWL